MATITETVRRPQVRQTQCFIGGKWVPSASGKTFETIHPATEEVICRGGRGRQGRRRRGRQGRPQGVRERRRGRRWTPATAAGC